MSVILYETNTLAHHGILGQKWGVRRFQNDDGSLTEAGRKRYARLDAKTDKLLAKRKKYNEDYDATYKKVSSNPKRERDKKRTLSNMEIAKYEFDTKLDYKLAKIEGRRNPEYKESDAYKDIVQKYKTMKSEDLADAVLGVGSYAAGFILGYLGTKALLEL